MLRIIGVILFVVVLLLGIPLSALNAEPISIRYFGMIYQWPLSLVLVASFSLGALVATVFCLSVLLPLRWRVSRLQNAVNEQEQELGALRKRAMRNLRQA